MSTSQPSSSTTATNLETLNSSAKKPRTKTAKAMQRENMVVRKKEHRRRSSQRELRPRWMQDFRMPNP